MLAEHTPLTDAKSMSTDDKFSMKNKSLLPSPQFLSTAEAARMLGLSTTLIQTLVDQGDLKGWKTRGGHRRIALESVHEYRTASRHFTGTPAKLENRPTVSIVIESYDLMEELRTACASYNLPINVQFFDSVTEALLDLSNLKPDMFVVEMSMPRAQQEKTFQALENFNQRGNSTLSVVLITSEKDLTAHLPSGASSQIQVVSGPLSAIWLNAYLTGILASYRM